MSASEDEVGRLWKQFLEAYYTPVSHTPDSLPRARQLAELLAAALGPYDPEHLKGSHVHPWILVWEARGNLQEALRLAERDIARKRAQIDAGEFAAYPKLLLEAAEYLRDSLEFQAERYLKVGDEAKARECLHEMSVLGERYGLEPPEDWQVLSRHSKQR
jgi:hypothetical protein